MSVYLINVIYLFADDGQVAEEEEQEKGPEWTGPLLLLGAAAIGGFIGAAIATICCLCPSLLKKKKE